MKDKDLTTTQKRTICNILSSKSIMEAARKTKVNRKTIYAWLEKPEFKKELEKRINQIVNSAFTELQLSFIESVQVLRELIKSDNEAIKLHAAKTIMHIVINFLEIKEIEQRIEKIENHIKEME